jgi:hypothetical protein
MRPSRDLAKLCVAASERQLLAGIGVACLILSLTEPASRTCLSSGSRATGIRHLPVFWARNSPRIVAEQQRPATIASNTDRASSTELTIRLGFGEFWLRQRKNLSAGALIYTDLFQTRQAMTMNLRISRFGFVVVCGLAVGLLAEPPAALAGCNSGNVGNNDLLSSANCEAAATGVSATAVGTGAVASGSSSVAVGNGAGATAVSATAVGTGASAVGSNGSAFGSNSAALGANSTSVGFASGPGVAIAGATSIGAAVNFSAAGVFSTAIGAGASVATASQSTGNYSVAIGGGDGTPAGGNGAAASAAYSIAIGNQTTATAISTVAIGVQAGATGPGAVAIGNGTTASGLVGTAVGAHSGASAASSSAFGTSSNATAASSSAFGASTQALGTFSSAFGAGAVAVGASASAFGTSASANFANSTAIGGGAVTTQANQVAVGTAANTYTLAGVTSAASLAAQTGPTKVVTTDASGNLAAASFSPQDISTLQSNVGTLQQNVSVLQLQVRQAFEGTAIAIALGGAALPSDKRFAISTNWGNFRGQNAVGVAAQFRLTNYAVANFGVGGGFAQGGIGSRAGVTFAW